MEDLPSCSSEWRVARGWSQEELHDRLRRLYRLTRNFSDAPGTMTPERGWSRHRSAAVLAWEPPGPPLPGGPFERARVGIESYAFSDPAIVTGHFDPATPLLGRRMLLEIRALWLRWLCGVVVGATRTESSRERDVFGFCYETLEGHIERGQEWFLVTKSRKTGEIRFEIRAVWKPGNLPTWWSRVGFHLAVPVYQRLWHRRAQRRLRHLARHGEVTPPGPGRGRIVHEGPPMVLGVTQERSGGGPLGRTVMEASLRRIQWIIGGAGRERAHRPRQGAESDGGTRGGPRGGAPWRAAALGAVAGLRTLTAPALLSRSLAATEGSGTGGLDRLLASPAAARVLALLAAGELLADKAPFIPPRTRPLPLAGRALVGAVCGAAVATRQGRPSRTGAVAGAASAVAAAFAAHRLRRLVGRRLSAPDAIVALVEDVLAVAAARRFAAGPWPAGGGSGGASTAAGAERPGRGAGR